MPILSSQSGISAKAMGLTSSPFSAIGGGYWANYVYRAAPAYSTFTGSDCTTTDASGNLYVAARVDIVDPTAYVYKIDTTGSIVWQTQVGNLGTNEAFDTIKLDSSGNVYAAGYSTAGNGLFIAKFDTAGTLQWQRTVINNWTGSSISDIAIDSSGNIYASGQAFVGISTPTLDAFIIKLNSTATSITWQRFLSSPSGDQYLNKIVLDSAGNNIYAIGYDLATTPYNAIIVKYNSAGVLQWQRKITGGGGSFLYGLDIDSSGNIYTSGYYGGSPYAQNIVAKYNSSGVLQWGKNIFSTTSTTYSMNLKLDSSNNIYLNSVIGGTTGYAVIKLDNSGNILWSREIRYGNNGIGKTVEPIGTDIISTGTHTLQNGIVTQTNCKFPGDGSRTGLYSIPFAGPTVLYTGYAVQSASNAWADQAGTLTDSAGNFNAPVTSTLASVPGTLGSQKAT